MHDEEAQILKKLRQGERIEHYETVRTTKDGRQIDISLTVSPIRDAAGKIVGVSKVARDITERKSAEKSQRLLVEELNHRVKNTLAVVQSIANQTLRRSSRPSEFVSSFGDRIQALASTHTLLSQGAWQGAELRELVRTHVYVGGVDDRVSCSGPSVVLDPNTALHLAMVLHELSTNARKHGALSVQNGRLRLSWTVRVAETHSLMLQWVETGRPGTRAPKVRGFGTTLLEQTMQGNGSGTSIHYGADGISCEIVVPLPKQSFHSLSQPIIADHFRGEKRAPQPTLMGRRILVVEDEPLVAMDLEATLTDAGCIVGATAGSLERSLKLVDELEFDAALVDVNLNGQPVDELAAALARRKVPFAFVTGHGRVALPLAFRDARMISKPFRNDQVLDTLRLLFQPAAEVIPLRQK